MAKKFDTFYAEVMFNDGTIYTKIIKNSHPVSGNSKEYHRIVDFLNRAAFNRFDGWFTVRVHGMLSGSPHDWHLEQVPEEIMDIYPHDMDEVLPF